MLGDKDLALAGKMMDMHALQQKLTAHNLANANTPNFRKLSVEFSEELIRAIQSGDMDAVRRAQITITRAQQPGVDSDSEVAALAKNELLFTTFSEIAAFKMRMMRTAIQSR